jgi:hypothetical protein
MNHSCNPSILLNMEKLVVVAAVDLKEGKFSLADSLQSFEKNLFFKDHMLIDERVFFFFFCNR